MNTPLFVMGFILATKAGTVCSTEISRPHPQAMEALQNLQTYETDSRSKLMAESIISKFELDMTRYAERCLFSIPKIQASIIEDKAAIIQCRAKISKEERVFIQYYRGEISTEQARISRAEQAIERERRRAIEKERQSILNSRSSSESRVQSRPSGDIGFGVLLVPFVIGVLGISFFLRQEKEKEEAEEAKAAPEIIAKAKEQITITSAMLADSIKRISQIEEEIAIHTCWISQAEERLANRGAKINSLGRHLENYIKSMICIGMRNAEQLGKEKEAYVYLVNLVFHTDSITSEERSRNLEFFGITI